MDHDVAAEHLQVIRTLMERSALYRRTLAPIMLYVGIVGTAASVGGVGLGIEAVRAFCAWWLGAAVAAVTGAFVIARRQAIQDGEAFWSPPTLRVAQAIAPPLTAGLLFSMGLPVFEPARSRELFILANAMFYGTAAHGAGFFMPRGMKLFGWLIIAAAGAGIAALSLLPANPDARLDHAAMGALFGVLHLAYGVYLYLTERRKSAL